MSTAALLTANVNLVHHGRLVRAVDAASLPLSERLQQLQLDAQPLTPPDLLAHLRPLCTAIDMVFGSAAALSATFGYKVGPASPTPAKTHVMIYMTAMTKGVDLSRF